MKQDMKNNVRLNLKVLPDMLKRTSSSSCQGNSITAYCSLYEPLSTRDNFGHIFFFSPPMTLQPPPPPGSEWLWGQSGGWGGFRGCLLQHWASVIRTVQGWKDNRQNNVLFKDGSPPLFLKVERRREGAGLNTRQQEGRAVWCWDFRFRDGLRSNIQIIKNFHLKCGKRLHFCWY